jgi:hypothetical protein
MSVPVNEGVLRSRSNGRQRIVLVGAVLFGIMLGMSGNSLTRSALAAQRRDEPAAQQRGEPWVFTADAACVQKARAFAQRPMPEERVRRDKSSDWSQAQHCATEWDDKLREKMREFPKEAVLQLAMTHLEIPEYHDEQRLKGWPETANRTLGPAAGIFLSPFLTDVSNQFVIRSHATPPGMLVAFVVVMRQNGEPLTPNYEKLHLTWGMNCIWLHRTEATGIKGYVTHAKPNEPCRTDPPATHFGPLDVHRTPPPDGYGLAANAPAARFTDDANGNPLLGVPCFDGWCDIGPQGFPRREAAAYLTTTPSYYTADMSNMRRQTLIKGWYDEQYLEEPIGEFAWRETNVRAAFVPRPDINNLGPNAYDAWRHIADIHLDNAPAAASKWNRVLYKGWNKVELRKDAGSPGGFTYRYTGYPGGPGSDRTFDIFVMHNEHRKDVPLPGTTRWRQSMGDPGTWAPCGENRCCKS